MRIIQITNRDLGPTVYRPTTRTVNPRRRSAGVGDFWDDVTGYFGGGGTGGGLPNPQISIIPDSTGDWIDVADTVLGFFKRWQFKKRVDRACSDIVDGFWSGPDSWLEKYLALIPTLCSNRAPDAQVIAVMNQACSQMLSKLDTLARKYNNTNCAKGLQERPCNSDWRIGNIPPFPGPLQRVQQALQWRQQAEASGQLNCPPVTTNTNGTSGQLFGLDTQTLLLYLGVGLIGIIILKKVLD